MMDHPDGRIALPHQFTTIACALYFMLCSPRVQAVFSRRRLPPKIATRQDGGKERRERARNRSSSSSNHFAALPHILRFPSLPYLWHRLESRRWTMHLLLLPIIKEQRRCSISTLMLWLTAARKLSLQDLSSMAMTCKFFRQAAYSDSIWHDLFRYLAPAILLLFRFSFFVFMLVLPNLELQWNFTLAENHLVLCLEKRGFS
ncbi:hypothetical protein ACLOJK_019774, partial [Asimina triloba]